MQINDWRVWLAADDPPGDPKAMAAIEMTYGRRSARIWLSEAFLRDSPEEQRHTIVHELAHIFFAASEEIARTEMPDGAYQSWRLMHEYGVDAVADALAPRSEALIKLPRPRSSDQARP